MSATAAVPRRMTADEFWDFCQRPENQERSFELIRGEVVEMSRPTRSHGVVCLNVGFELKLWLRTYRVGHLATNDSGVVLEEDPDSVVGPDVAYYSEASRFSDLHPKWGDVPPVLAVEVLSPSDRPINVSNKVTAYLNNGVQVVWLIDYEEQRVSVLRPNQSAVVLTIADRLNGGLELPGFECAVANFFAVEGDAAP
jgi:Uma2 family endonuclease